MAGRHVNSFVMFNRRCRPEQECFVSPACRAIALGEACFETFRLYKNDRVSGFEAHLNRLRRGASELGFDADRHHPAFDFSPGQVARELLYLKKKCGGIAQKSAAATPVKRRDFRVRIQIGRADTSGIYDDAPESRAFFSLIRMVTAGPPGAPVRLWTSRARRIPRQTQRQDVKWSFYQPNVQALRQAREHRADDALMLDGHGNISASATANVFFFYKDALLTPPPEADALTGITRAQVIAAAEANGQPVRWQHITPEQARAAEAGFITSSVRGISPIQAIDGHALSVNHSGLHQVIKVFNAYINRTAASLADL